MKTKVFSILVLAMFATIAFLVIFRSPATEICADDVRGYEQDTSAKLNATRSEVATAKIALGIEQTNRLLVPIDNLSAGNFGALKALDTQCKLLARCARYSFNASAAEACPEEYADYNRRVDSVLSMLQALEAVRTAASEVAKQADSILSTRDKIDTLTLNSSGATGRRIAILKAQLENQEQGLGVDVKTLQDKIEQLAAISE